MKCDRCEAEATVHEVVRAGGQMVERHLCEQCAKNNGIAVPHLPINKLIQQYVLQQQGAAAAAPAPAAKVCPACRLPYNEFRQSGLLGCPECYAAFSAALDPLLERAHEGGHWHTGKTPKRLAVTAMTGPKREGAKEPGKEAPKEAKEVKETKEAAGVKEGVSEKKRPAAPAKSEVSPVVNERAEHVKRLSKQLEDAVKAEQYERAAVLRDEIKKLNEGTAAPSAAGPGGAGRARKSPDSAA